MKKTPQAILLGAALLALVVGGGGCLRHKHAQPDLAATQEPDKVLYEHSVEDIKNHRYDVARLTLQTLINTYPDSEYLPAAKLAIADSYFEEDTTASLTHAEVEYKDFITFFPNSPETSYAQYRAAMCHYRQLEKPDRDRTHARRAEEEFQQLLRTYPDSKYAAEGEQRLIQVQEILADAEFRIGRFYYIRESYRASMSRLADLVESYPNYSQRDQALWLLGQGFQKKIPYFWPGDPKRAADYLARLVREHPLSEYADDAKAELANLGHPAPEPDPVLLARAQAVQPIDLPNESKKGLLGRMFGLLSDKPDLSAAAARLGPPPLEPPAELPSLPKPNLQAAVGQQGAPQANVNVQTVEDVPAGTVVQGQPGQGNNAQGDNPPNEATKEQAQKKEQETKPRKKSIWRKLVPFW